MIRDGTSEQYDWKGYVPFEQMPSILNPESGTVYSANNKAVSDDPDPQARSVVPPLENKDAFPVLPKISPVENYLNYLSIFDLTL